VTMPDGDLRLLAVGDLRSLAVDDQKFTKLRQRYVEDRKQRAGAYTAANGREFPFTTEKDVLGTVLEAISRVCDVAVPDCFVNGTGDPRMAYMFVVDALVNFGDSRQEEGRVLAVNAQPVLTREMRYQMQALHSQLAFLLR